ncbi:hypothetical protein KY362_05240 [Candidatus Woesearchaeota archaeon]|nr:hypothetical protein [Candidatus Woesearchaeota archaeon]
MKLKIALTALSLILIMMMAGCSAPMCYPPSKVIGNKCCVDENANNVCDYDEEPAPAEEPEEAELTEEPAQEAEEETPAEEEPKIQTVPKPAPAPAPETDDPEFGKMKIKTGEPREYLTIDKITSFRTSRDKGMLDEIHYTVRNLGTGTITPTVEFFFDNEGMDFSETERVYEYPLRVLKEYKLESLKPGEKHVIKQSLGIRFQGIEQPKQIEMSVYDRYSSPKKDLAKVERKIKPVDLFETMEIYTYSRPDE